MKCKRKLSHMEIIKNKKPDRIGQRFLMSDKIDSGRPQNAKKQTSESNYFMVYLKKIHFGLM
jgi:hypothetical protein